MTYVDRLNQALKDRLRHPWSQDKSGGERVWFLVFDPDKLRTVLAHKEAFRLSTEAAGKRWEEIDISREFGAWMANHRYARRYFARPSLATTIADDFASALVANIKRQMDERRVDEQTLVVITGTESLYGINKLSHVTRLLEDAIPGRLLVFFPGEYREPQYRFLDARDGWNYLAIPIVP
jgi:hypothetical protein